MQPKKHTMTMATLTIEYDGAELEEIKEQKRVPYEERPISAARPVRGLTPQRRLLSCQKLLNDTSSELSKTNLMSRVEPKDQFG